MLSTLFPSVDGESCFLSSEDISRSEAPNRAGGAAIDELSSTASKES